LPEEKSETTKKAQKKVMARQQLQATHVGDDIEDIIEQLEIEDKSFE